MIMALRDYVLHNFRWKLIALLLAVLVWSVIKFALYQEIMASRNQVLNDHPVMILRAPDDGRMFRIDPPTVDLVIQAPKQLTGEDVEVYLDLTTLSDLNTALKQVLVRAADPIRVVRAEPAYVLVERFPLPDTGLTNVLGR
ncbi:MAG: hypothetical protein AB9869_29585 [Verrucomicrobiia bacterium]